MSNRNARNQSQSFASSPSPKLQSSVKARSSLLFEMHLDGSMWLPIFEKIGSLGGDISLPILTGFHAHMQL